MKVLYTAAAMSSGDARNGHVRSSDGLLDVDLATPKEMGGAGGASNPEQLFAAGYAACFESALRLVMRLQKKSAADVVITAHVTLNTTDDQKYILSVELHGNIAGVSSEETLTLMHVAHGVCPYSNATRGNIDVKLVSVP